MRLPKIIQRYLSVDGERNLRTARWAYLVRLIRMLYSVSPRGMLVVIITTVFIGVGPLLPLVVFGRLVDVLTSSFSPTGGMRSVLLWAVATIFAASLERTAMRISVMVRDEVQEDFKFHMQDLLIRKSQSLDLLLMEQGNVLSKVSRIERGIDRRFFSTMTFVFNSINSAVTLVTLSVYLTRVNILLPAIVAVGTSIFVAFRTGNLRKRYLIERNQSEDQRRLDYVASLLTGKEAAAEVRLFQLGTYLLASWKRLFSDLRQERLAQGYEEFKCESISGAGQVITLGVALMIVLLLVSNALLSVGQFAVCLGVINQFQASSFEIFWNFALIDNDLLYIQDFFEFLDLHEYRRAEDAVHRFERVDFASNVDQTVDSQEDVTVTLDDLCIGIGTVTFENVSFQYPGSERLSVSNINLKVQRGESIAIVGRNGSGKTTLVKLLLGLYRPTSGRILINDVDVATIDISRWRDCVSAVFQDFQMFSMSIRDNISIGSSSNRDDTAGVRTAAIRAEIDELIDALPDGYETQLGKEFGGVLELSRGQWQKLAIARAYFRNAELIVLDEPTAALDPRAEVEVYSQFRQAVKGKTAILISHRLGSARLADRIVVLDDGNLAEDGKHDELIGANGIYAEMFRIQASWYD